MSEMSGAEHNDAFNSQADGAVLHSEHLPPAASEVLQTVCGVELAPCETSEPTDHGNMIMGVISLAGQVQWSVFLSLPSQTATTLAANFAGCEIPFDSSDMGDAVGELTNMIAGKVKASLDAKGLKSEISLPSIMRGQGFEVLGGSRLTQRKFSFDSQAGKVYVGILASQDEQ
jgi:chemotaxis protein CheX